MAFINQIEYIKIAFIIGIMLGFYFTTKYKISSGGIVVPGYIASLLTRPFAIILLFIIAALAYNIMESFYKKYMILYGRRKFMLNILTGAVLSLFFDSFISNINLTGVEFQLIGMVTPGIIANEFEKSGGTAKTTITTLIIAAIVYLITNAILILSLSYLLAAIIVFTLFSFCISAYQSYELKKKMGIDPLKKKRAYRLIVKYGYKLFSLLEHYIFFRRR